DLSRNRSGDRGGADSRRRRRCRRRGTGGFRAPAANEQNEEENKKKPAHEVRGFSREEGFHPLPGTATEAWGPVFLHPRRSSQTLRSRSLSPRERTGEGMKYCRRRSSFGRL